MANIEHTINSPAQQLVQHFNADESHKSSHTDQLVNATTGSINAVHFESPIAVDLSGGKSKGFSFCFHCCCGFLRG